MKLVLGAKLLRERLERRPNNQLSTSIMAGILGVSKAAIYSWRTGDRRPDYHIRLALEQTVGIPADSWMTNIERMQLEQAVQEFRNLSNSSESSS